MKDILRDLYFGQYVSDTSVKMGEQLQSAERNLDKTHDKIMEALIEKYGREEAIKIDDSYTEAYTALSNEELLQAYKSGIHFGLSLMIDLFK